MIIFPEHSIGAKTQEDQEELSDTSYDSLTLPEEFAPGTESEDEQLRTYSPPSPEQVPEVDDGIEKYNAEPEQPKTAISTTSGKKKKKAKASSKLHIPADPPSEHPVD